MKNEDLLEQVKRICKKEGIEVVVESEDQGLISVRKVDEWEGVEFVECVSVRLSITKGKIYPTLRKVKLVNGYGISIYDDAGTCINVNVKHLIPSTEQAYKEQLFQEAKERFGEIKVGDVFERKCLNNQPGFMTENVLNNDQFKYWKKNDCLTVGGAIIYNNGQWAKKIEKPEAVFVGVEYGYKSNKFNFRFDDKGQDLMKIGKYLADCLKEYLNKNQND